MVLNVGQEVSRKQQTELAESGWGKDKSCTKRHVEKKEGINLAVGFSSGKTFKRVQKHPTGGGKQAKGENIRNRGKFLQRKGTF